MSLASLKDNCPLSSPVIGSVPRGLIEEVSSISLAIKLWSCVGDGVSGIEDKSSKCVVLSMPKLARFELISSSLFLIPGRVVGFLYSLWSSISSEAAK